MRILPYFEGKKFEGYEAVQSRVLGLVNHAHAAATDFLDDAVVRDRLADKGIAAWHAQPMLGCDNTQVNKRTSANSCLKQDGQS